MMMMKFVLSYALTVERLKASMSPQVMSNGDVTCRIDGEDGMEFLFKLDPHYGVGTTRYYNPKSGLYIYFSRTGKAVEFGCQTGQQNVDFLTKGQKEDWEKLKDVFPLKHLSSETIDTFKTVSKSQNNCDDTIKRLLDDPPPGYEADKGSSNWITRIHEDNADKITKKYGEFREDCYARQKLRPKEATDINSKGLFKRTMREYLKKAIKS